ncbi:MAG: hypothetical protein ACTSPY_06395 [Candidatus Helarchaeota archaeon]
MLKVEINYEKKLQDYKELLFGPSFDSNKKKNRIRLFYYKLILKNLFHFIYSTLISFPHIIRIAINMTREMGFSIFGDYIGLNFYIIDRMRQMKLIRDDIDE